MAALEQCLIAPTIKKVKKEVSGSPFCVSPDVLVDFPPSIVVVVILHHPSIVFNHPSIRIDVIVAVVALPGSAPGLPPRSPGSHRSKLKKKVIKSQLNRFKNVKSELTEQQTKNGRFGAMFNCSNYQKSEKRGIWLTFLCLT